MNYTIIVQELDILPLRFKYLLTDMIIFYKIVNSLITTELPDEFSLFDPNKVRYTRNTENILPFFDAI